MGFEIQVEPRRWQREAVDAWVGNSRRGIVRVVTGGGKTMFAALCMQEALRSGVVQNCLIVVPTLALLDQWCVSLSDEFGLSDAKVALWSGSGRPERPALVNVMVLNSARMLSERFAPYQSTVLVVDECHHAGSAVNSLAIRHPFGATLGMSATPESEFDDRFSGTLQPALGPVVYSYDLDDAYQDGIIAAFDLVNVQFDLLPEEQEEYERWTRKIARFARRHQGEEAAEDALKSLLRRRAACSAKARLRVPVAVHIADLHRGARTMIFHESIAAAETIKDQLVARGHNATIYHSQIATAMRRDNLRLFRRGAFDILVTCRALDEGVNIPEVQVAIVASATASTRQRVQRLGRVLRPAPKKDRALIYTLYATPVEARRLRKEESSLRSANSITWQRVKTRHG